MEVVEFELYGLGDAGKWTERRMYVYVCIVPAVKQWTRSCHMPLQTSKSCNIWCLYFQYCIQTVGIWKWNYPYSDVEALRLFHYEEHSQVRLSCRHVHLYLLFTNCEGCSQNCWMFLIITMPMNCCTCYYTTLQWHDSILLLLLLLLLLHMSISMPLPP